MKNKISVALCTYNGELYLREQLESILKQTHLPDEIIVCDDCSTDSTLEILDEFRKIFPIPFEIYLNKKNLGVSKNFERAISLCTGDIIVLSDQDDVWMLERIKKVIEVFDNKKDCSYVFSNAYVVNENLYQSGYTMWESISFNKRQRENFKKGFQLDILLKHYVVTGATMAFRSELKKNILPIPNIWFHDAWIALMGSIFGKGCFIDEPLIYYRQHNSQLIGGKKSSIVEKSMKSLSTGVYNYFIEKQRYGILNDRVFRLLGEINSKIQDKISFLVQRIKIYESSGLSGLPIITRELFNGRYFKYSNGLESAVKDFFVVFKNLISKILKRDRA